MILLSLNNLWKSSALNISLESLEFLNLEQHFSSYFEVSIELYWLSSASLNSLIFSLKQFFVHSQSLKQNVYLETKNHHLNRKRSFSLTKRNKRVDYETNKGEKAELKTIKTFFIQKKFQKALYLMSEFDAMVNDW